MAGFGTRVPFACLAGAIHGAFAVTQHLIEAKRRLTRQNRR
jgi:hypothetical protein